MDYGGDMNAVAATAQTRRGFASIAALYAVTMIGGTLPVPLWHSWSVRLRFGPMATTTAFAVYAVGTVVALTLFARTSEQVGRRPVLVAGLTVTAISSGLLLVASDVAMIMLARLLGGIGAGLVTTTASAALNELADPAHPRLAAATPTLVNVGGLGAGILIAAYSLQIGGENAATVRWLYAGYLITVVTAGVGVSLIPETVPDASWAGFHWSIARPTLPPARADRAMFGWAAASVFVAFAVTGLFSSLVPGFLREDIRLTSPLSAGLVVASLFMTALVTQLVSSERAMQSLWLGCAALSVGTALYESGLVTDRLEVFIVGTVAAGSGFGLVFGRGLHATQQVAAPGRRADQLATYFLCAYAGNVVPTVGLGTISEITGGRAASVGLAVLIALGALISGAGASREQRAGRDWSRIDTEAAGDEEAWSR